MKKQAEVARLPGLGRLSISVRPVLDPARSRLIALGVLPWLERPQGALLKGAAIWTAAAGSRDLEDLCQSLSAALSACWRHWSEQGLKPRLSIPVQLLALRPEKIRRSLCEQLIAQGIPPDMLEFRIDEHELVDKVRQVYAVAKQVRLEGASIAVGPFGASHAHLDTEDGPPFDAIWLRPEFLAQLQSEDGMSAAMREALAAARMRGIPVIAQGVDTPEQLAMLPPGVCAGVQGDAVAPRMLPDDLPQWLQAQAEGPAPKEAASGAPSGNGGSPPAASAERCALVVDDDPLIRNMLKHQLAQLGIEDCDTAEDGAQAKDRVSSRPSYSVIFCDLQMPGVDGVEFLRFAAERIPLVSVVLISSVDAKILRAAASLAQAHQLKLLGTLHKPVRLETLRSLLERLDREQRTQAVESGRPAVEYGEAELRAAIEQRQIQPYFQPQLSVESGDLIGAEALVRWPDPDGMRSPGAFLPAVTRAGLMPELTRMMIEASLDTLALWRTYDLKLSVSVNVPMEVLSDLAFPERLSALCQERGFASDVIKLEITESSAMRDPVVTLDVVTRLRMRGFSLAIDDFGTGFSSLSQLREIPFNQLKIDQSFVSISQMDDEARLIVKNNIDLARSLEMISVAEGVETAEDWRLLRQLGCDALQGFFASPALSAEDFVRWVQGDYAQRRAQWELPPA